MTMRRNVRGNGSSNCCKRFVLTGAEAVARHKRQGHSQWTKVAGSGKQQAASGKGQMTKQKLCHSVCNWTQDRWRRSARKHRESWGRQRNRSWRGGSAAEGSAHPSTGSVIELNGHTAREVSNVRVWVNVNPLYRKKTDDKKSGKHWGKTPWGNSANWLKNVAWPNGRG